MGQSFFLVVAPPPPISDLCYLTQSEYRGILKSVGLEEAPTSELLERELKVLGRKKEAEMTYHRLRESVEASKNLDQPGSAPGSTEEVEYSAIVNDSTDAEGEPDTTASAPPIATENVNGEKVQKVQAQDEIKVKPSPAPEVCAITFQLRAVLTRVLPKDHDELQVRGSRLLASWWGCVKNDVHFRRTNSPMASGNDPFLVIFAPGEDVAALAKKVVPASPARSAALHAHTLPSHERT
jgi:hypothetical protein